MHDAPSVLVHEHTAGAFVRAIDPGREQRSV
jgi:hypothetical protein